jgi:hypothetical protein
MWKECYCPSFLSVHAATAVTDFQFRYGNSVSFIRFDAFLWVKIHVVIFCVMTLCSLDSE